MPEGRSLASKETSRVAVGCFSWARSLIRLPSTQDKPCTPMRLALHIRLRRILAMDSEGIANYLNYRIADQRP
jgi:hypothetical protein